MEKFDPSQFISSDLGIFGLPITEANAKVVLLPVPWEVTTSYGKGASFGPEIIRQSSEQVDLFDFDTGNSFEAGYFMREIPASLLELNKISKSKVGEVTKLLSEQVSSENSRIVKLQKEVNDACDKMTDWVYNQSKEILSQNKILGLVGGDHSTPLGAIRAISEAHQGEFGILHIDAHADLRVAYQGFTQSHASIMYNVMSSKFKPKQLVQVGIRDFSEDEYNEIQKSEGKIKTFFDLENKRRLLEGTTWSTIAKEIIQALPQKIYISFDIDGLDPALCPNTGTPVPGGLSMDQVFYLFREIFQQKKQIIGFDLNEVSGGETGVAEWDGNVGARVLFKMCGWAVKTNK
jgi:agmatinase